MATTALTAPILLVGTTAADAAVQVSKVAADDATVNSATTVIEASGDIKSQNVGGHKVAIGPFTVTNIATSAAATALLFASVAGMTQVASPYAGSVLGVSIHLNANLTAGTLTIFATVNGATTIFSTANAATGVSVIYNTQAKDVDAIAAGDGIGMQYKTTASFAPTTLEGVGYVWIEV